MTYDGFISGFCKVEFLCFAGEPNWLGLIALGWGGLMVMSFVLLLLIAPFR